MLYTTTLLPALLLPLALAKGVRRPKGGSGNGASETTSGAAASSTATTTHDVLVGEGGDLKFDPDTVRANVGDAVNFHFYAQNHSVVQSTYDTPCQPLGSSSLIYSGFEYAVSGDGEADQMFSVTVQNTNPIWLYCSQGNHCQEKMVMVINPATSSGAENLDDYADKAEDVETNRSPTGTTSGGVVLANQAPTDDDDDDSTARASATGSATAAGSGATLGSATSAAGGATSTGGAGVVRVGAAAGAMAAAGLGAWALL